MVVVGSGSGQDIATVTESDSSRPLPSETMHGFWLGVIPALAVAVAVNSAVSPNFTRAIAGSNVTVTPSHAPSWGRSTVGVERIAAAS